ncbi:HAD family phosphatase [Roseibium sp. RKSG952]|uniref:HAD family hydrolase n=1 Tax=Roseibium sp. RKSG952 TaxID=2529384 RepID=UPI0012BCD9AA|nr:HAD-IB family hydrolase [Roseibium sp. RKSG952]MTH98447.1 HAD-IB family hydrolase [Roseibium sp. RKSG952]
MTSAHLSSVPATAPDLVVFDLDQTITTNDTYVYFLLSVLRKRPWRLVYCIPLPFAVAMHKMGLRNNTWLKRVFLRAICGGCEREFVEQLGDDVAGRVISKKLRPGAIPVLERHKNRGDRIAIATASIDIYALAIAERLGIDKVDVLCTQAQWNGSKLTGDLASQNLYGSNKTRAVQNWAESAGRSDIDVAYSDHHSDFSLLESARHGVAVNPNDRLMKLASEADLEVVDWNVIG